MLRALPIEKVVIQELVFTDIIQGEVGVDGQEQGAVDRHQLEPLQARLQAGQLLRPRLLQPVHVGLEAKEGTFGEMEG